MIDTYLLEELAVFAKTGTLAKTAELLNTTQPSLTRGMKKIEEELGVKLFDRKSNKITLTKTGILAATYANQLIEDNRKMIKAVQNFEQSQSIINVASTIPGPNILINDLRETLPGNLNPSSLLLSIDHIEESLKNNEFSIIFSNQEILSDEIESQFLGIEELSVNLDQFMIEANNASITFHDLDNLSFVVMTDIGTWSDIIQNEITNAKFMYQTGTESFQEITKYSNFPFFSTNISNPKASGDRVNIPISDQSAKMTIYANYLKKNKSMLKILIGMIRNDWPK